MDYTALDVASRGYERLVRRIESWPILSTMSSRPMTDLHEIMEWSRRNLEGTLPSLFKRLPRGITSVLRDACASEEEGRWYGYGFASGDDVKPIASRTEPLAALPNNRVLLTDDSDSNLVSRMINAEEVMEKHIVGPKGMRKNLSYFTKVCDPKSVGQQIPYVVRSVVRPDVWAPEESGLRVTERVLQTFLAGMYGECFVIALDRKGHDVNIARATVSWNWRDPPRSDHIGPRDEKGKYHVGIGALVRDAPLAGCVR